MKNNFFRFSLYSLLLIGIIFFTNQKCYAQELSISAKLNEKEHKNIVIDFSANSNTTNIYGIMGVLDYNEQDLSLISCSGANDFHASYSNGILLVDDYQKHNENFNFATCTFELKNKDVKIDSTMIGLKNITYSTYDNSSYMNDVIIPIDLTPYYNHIENSSIFTIVLGFLKLHFLSIVLPIFIVIALVIVFLSIKNIMKKKKQEQIIPTYNNDIYPIPAVEPLMNQDIGNIQPTVIDIPEDVFSEELSGDVNLNRAESSMDNLNEDSINVSSTIPKTGEVEIKPIIIEANDNINLPIENIVPIREDTNIVSTETTVTNIDQDYNQQVIEIPDIEDEEQKVADNNQDTSNTFDDIGTSYTMNMPQVATFHNQE